MPNYYAGCRFIAFHSTGSATPYDIKAYINQKAMYDDLVDKLDFGLLDAQQIADVVDGLWHSTITMRSKRYNPLLCRDKERNELKLERCGKDDYLRWSEYQAQERVKAFKEQNGGEW
jgi:hypothetical protein